MGYTYLELPRSLQYCGSFNVRKNNKYNKNFNPSVGQSMGASYLNQK